jgi:general secretion pathway protein L
MAGSVLKRNEWVVYMPARGDGQHRLGVGSEFLAFAPGSNKAARFSLDSMLEHAKTKQLVLLADTRDVLFLQAKVPPLSGAKLRLALPNVLEDQLMQDPSQVCIAMGPKLVDGEHLMGVIDRAWLEHVLSHFERKGFKILQVLPLCLTLHRRSNRLTLAVVNDGLSLRSEAKALGWHGGQEPIGRVDAIEFALQALGSKALEGLGGVDFQTDDEGWLEAAQVACAANGLSCQVEALTRPQECALDLLTGLGSRRRSASSQWDWSVWRWPAWLAAACLGVWLLGLNLDWFNKRQELSELQVARDRKFKQAMPNSRTDAEPVLQLKRQLASVRAQAGQAGAEDFSPLLARLSAALGARSVDALASINYRDNKLRVKFQPGIADSEAARQSLRDACARNGLKLQFDGDREVSAVVSLSS